MKLYRWLAYFYPEASHLWWPPSAEPKASEILKSVVNHRTDVIRVMFRWRNDFPSISKKFDETQDWIWRKKLSRFCCSAFISFVLTMMPIRSTTEITELVMIVTPIWSRLMMIDDDDNIDDYHDWPPFPLWLRSASSIVPISLSCDEALPPRSSQTKPKQTTPTM